MTTNPASILAAARAIQPDVVAIRRRIHRQPEVGLDLPRTQAVILEVLSKLGLEGRRGTALSSVVAVVDGGRPGPTVLLRGDMDALPLQEDTGLDFSSEIDGAMHACGHDTHVAMLARRGSAARRNGERAPGQGEPHVPARRGRLPRRALHDRGGSPRRGRATPGPLRCLRDPHLTRYPPARSTSSGPPDGGVRRLPDHGPGRGGHASAPHLALDPIAVAAEIVHALQAMVTRRIDIFDPAVVTIAQITSGTTNNVIPEPVVLFGTIRTVSERDPQGGPGGVRRVAEGIAAAHGATAEVDLEGATR